MTKKARKLSPQLARLKSKGKQSSFVQCLANLEQGADNRKAALDRLVKHQNSQEVKNAEHP
jgi:hypothetical protein